MFKILITILSIFGSAAAWKFEEIRQFQADKVSIIETSPANYAISGPALLKNGWKSVSVNGGQVNIYSSNCELITRELRALSTTERVLLEESLTGAKDAKRSGGNRAARFRTLDQTSDVDGYISSSFAQDGLSFLKYNDNNFSISRRGMKLARTFVNGDTLTYVYLNGEVMMKPESCLQPEEQQQLRQDKSDIRQAEEGLQRRMHQFGSEFHQNLRNIHRNINSNMDAISRNIQLSIQESNRNAMDMFN